ncbi:hypothetical protein, partial [Magnetospirillum molischianum]
MTANPRDALAFKHFPAEWCRIVNKPGASKKRQQLRKRGEEAETVLALRAKGASCATCNGYEKAPHPKELGFTHYCAADSDFHGYVGALATGLCHRWAERK